MGSNPSVTTLTLGIHSSKKKVDKRNAKPYGSKVQIPPLPLSLIDPSVKGSVKERYLVEHVADYGPLRSSSDR